jgi:outer membrane beta-barrel protein
MYKLPVLLLLSFLLSRHSIAQAGHIKGKITDSTEQKDLANGSVLLLRSADSILVRFTRTDKGGNFLLNNIPAGKFILLISYPSYADYVDQVEVKDSAAAISLPPIGMVLKSALLQQVIVTGNKEAIRIKGDTVEFKADSFHTQAGATVEDLLKKLPGIQVDKNGKITAQGETVQKVLVDGEEFFGDDPTLVIQNLRADMVDKVQVYDKKSDQAAFTGIDDGQKSKTINLKLKDDKKNGYFGKLSAGAGTDGYYDAQAMLNMFRKKEKLAAYGIISNTGKTGLNWQERDNYGQSVAGLLDYDDMSGNYSFNGGSNDLDSWDGKYNGQGLPSVKTGGIHYNDKWGDDRFSVNGNYKAMLLTIQDTSNTSTQYILPDTLYYNNQRQRSTNQIMRHSFDGSYEVKFDSTSSLKIMADGGTDHKTTNSWFSSDAIASDSSLVNENTRTISTTGDSRILNSNFLWRKKLPKKGRTLSVNFRENYTNSSSDGYLNSNTWFYSGGIPSADSLIDQYKKYHTENILLDSKIAYTEPLSAVSFLVANYGISFNKNNSDRNSYNKDPGGKYSELDSLYSNNYQFDVFTQKGGLAYSLVKKKFRFNAGSNIGLTSFDQQDLVADTSAKRHFVNWYPQANASYSFSNQRRLNIQYNGNTVQPTLQQIQPVQTNEDPLNIVIGNPGLKPQFRNRIGLNYSEYQVFTERSIWANLSYTFTQNAISSNVNVDSTGKRITQSINVNGNYSVFGYIEYGFKWKKPGLNISVYTNDNQSNNVSMVNNLLNTTRSGNYKLGIRLYKSKEKKYEFSLNTSADYTQSQSSINTGVQTDYWIYEINPAADLFLPLKFQVHADCDVNLRQKTSVFNTNNNVTILNGWIGKKFGKNDALLVKASGNDLLNQNVGFSRSVNSNFISQNRYSSIQRYYMLSVVWNFTKAGAAAPAER